MSVFPSAWTTYLHSMPNQFNNLWIHGAMSQDMDLFLLFYHDLLHNLERALVKLAYFLGVDLSPQTLQCVLEHKEGHYHRSEENYEVFRGVQTYTKTFYETQEMLRQHVRECMAKKKCMTSGCGFLTI